jgi:hypothetical protein
MNIATVLSPAADVRYLEFAGAGVETRYLPMMLARPIMDMMVRSVRKRRTEGSTLAVNHVLFDGWGKFCAMIRKGAASWQALNIIYNYDGQGSLLDRLWIGHMRNAQAVRNRKRIITQVIHEMAASAAKRGKIFRLLSLASGSAQPAIEGLSDVSTPVEMLLIDFDRSAGPYAMKIAKKYGLENAVNFKPGNLFKFDRKVLLNGFDPDTIEIAGFFDYLRDEEAVLLLRRIYEVLPSGGHLITCHIHDNVERPFMTDVIEWGRDDGKQRPMLYRTREELVRLVQAGGFNSMTVITEPHQIHSVVVARR